MSIRILSLVPYQVYPAIMGGQKGIALFYKYLSQLVSLSVFTTPKNTEAEPSIELIKGLSNARTRYLNPFLFFTIKKICREKNTSHLLFEHPYYAWLIFLCKHFSSQKIIVHSHNIESERFKSIGKWWWKLLWYYERWAYSQASILWFKTNEDKQYAHIHYGIPHEKCHVIPYGIEAQQLPTAEELMNAKQTIQAQYQIPSHHTILLFNGTLSYKPNYDALMSILEKINPLLSTTSMEYTILICGKGLPTQLKNLEAYKTQHIIYAGFVEDIDLYFKACDIFLNPLQDGGGIKTKLVEALGFGKYAVSSQNGAIGVEAKHTSGLLQVVADKDWQAYVHKITNFNQVHTSNNQDFYSVFSWVNIAQKALQTLGNK